MKKVKLECPECCIGCPFAFKPSRLCRNCKNFEEAKSFWDDYDELDYEPFEVI